MRRGWVEDRPLMAKSTQGFSSKHSGLPITTRTACITTKIQAAAIQPAFATVDSKHFQGAPCLLSLLNTEERFLNVSDWPLLRALLHA